MSKWHFRQVLTGLRNLRYMIRNKALRAYIDALVEQQKNGLDLYDETIFQAQMTGVRNPEFPGDMVGRPDDDFDDDEDDKTP